MSDSKQETKPLIGWREWVGLPALGIETVKAKVDTGARTSSLHAYNIEEFTRDGQSFVRFEVHPEQRDEAFVLSVEAPLLEMRQVRPSTGESELRPVIQTTIQLLGQTWEAELTLTNRDVMGFRMLLGREAIRPRFLVEPDSSFIGGRRVKGTKRLKKSKKK